jgi:hypothetical protein
MHNIASDKNCRESISRPRILLKYDYFSVIDIDDRMEIMAHNGPVLRCRFGQPYPGVTYSGVPGGNIQGA